MIQVICVVVMAGCGALTCPCALVTNCPVTPCRLERGLPNTWEPAMEFMAAAATAA